MILSIVIPAFNASKHLCVALQSVAPMLSADVELIVVDDGSTDDTADVFEDLRASLNLRNARIARQAHSGVSVARNLGAVNAAGDYIVFLDSDDTLCPAALDEVRRASKEQPDLICWGWDIIGTNGRMIRRYFDIHPDVPSHMSGVEALRRRTIDRSLRLWTTSVAYRRLFLESERLRFTPGCGVGEDLEFNYLALLCAQNVVFVPQVLSVYRKRNSSVSQQASPLRFESVLALRRVSLRLQADSRPEVREIGRHFDQTKILVNYLYTLESCLTSMQASTSSAQTFARDLERTFPNLTTGIRESLRRARKGGLAVPVEWSLFELSPTLWWSWVRLRRRADVFLPERFRSTGAAVKRRRDRLLSSGRYARRLKSRRK